MMVIALTVGETALGTELYHTYPLIVIRRFHPWNRLSNWP